RRHLQHLRPARDRRHELPAQHRAPPRLLARVRDRPRGRRELPVARRQQPRGGLGRGVLAAAARGRAPALPRGAVPPTAAGARRARRVTSGPPLATALAKAAKPRLAARNAARSVEAPAAGSAAWPLVLA